MSEISERVKGLIEPLLIEKNFELYAVEYQKEGHGWVLRVYADNSTRSISLDECAEISHMLSDLLDTNEDLELHAYSLEVSSPGLDRLLRNDADYQWAMGKTLKVKYKNGAKKEVVEGKLEKFDANSLELSLGKKNSITVKREGIESARRVMKFNELIPKDHNKKPEKLP